jgi:hypothetical protein
VCRQRSTEDHTRRCASIHILLGHRSPGESVSPISALPDILRVSTEAHLWWQHDSLVCLHGRRPPSELQRLHGVSRRPPLPASGRSRQSRNPTEKRGKGPFMSGLLRTCDASAAGRGPGLAERSSPGRHGSTRRPLDPPEIDYHFGERGGFPSEWLTSLPRRRRNRVWQTRRFHGVLPGSERNSTDWSECDLHCEFCPARAAESQRRRAEWEMPRD